MLVRNQIVQAKWSGANKKWYIDKGYEYTKFGDVFDVKAEDLPKGSHIKVAVECDYCHNIVYVAWRDYLHYKYDKYSCKHCRQKKTSEYNLKQRQDYLYNKALEVCESLGYIMLTKKEDIKTADSRVEYLCEKHGVNNTKIYTLFLGHGCPECAYEYKAENAKLSPDLVEQRINEYGGVLLNKEDYSGCNDKNLNVICPECGNLFLTSYFAYTHRGGQICPNCSKTKSFGEYLVMSYLDDNNISYQREYRFDDCKDKIPLPFDFYLHDYNMLIEVNGRQHYESVDYFGGENALQYVQSHDKIKKQYCQNNNIKLLIIPYWDIDNIDNILAFNLHNDIV